MTQKPQYDERFTRLTEFVDKLADGVTCIVCGDTPDPHFAHPCQCGECWLCDECNDGTDFYCGQDCGGDR